METQYAVHSVVRKAAFRTHRATLPAALRKRQFVCNQSLRLVPARRLLIPESLLLKHLDELKEKAAAHILEVRTPDGRLVDLSTMTPGPADPKVVAPHPRLDSVKYDRPTGQYIPPYVGDDSSMPQVLKHGEKPALLTQAASTKALDDEAAAAAADPAVAEAAAAETTEVTTDAELDAAIEAAQKAASDEDPPAAAPEVSSEETSQSGRRRKGRR